jgi:hypothetical protein
MGLARFPGGQEVTMYGVPDNAYRREIEDRHDDVLEVRVPRTSPGLIRIASVPGINGGVWLDIDEATAARDALDEAIIAAQCLLDREAELRAP